MVNNITHKSHINLQSNQKTEEKSLITRIRKLFVRKDKKVELVDHPMSPKELHRLLDSLPKSLYKETTFNKMLSKYGGKIINPKYLLSQINLIQDRHSRNSAMNKMLELELKLIGHEFDVGGEIRIKNKRSNSFLKFIEQKIFGIDSRKVKLEGFDRIKAHGKVADSMESFLCAKRGGKENLSEKEKMLLEALHKSVRYDESTLKAREILNDIKSGKPVTIPTGWQGHAVEVTIYNGLLCYSNRGDHGEGFQPGLHVYQINPDQIDLKFIKKLLVTSSYTPNIYTIFHRKKEAKDRLKWFEHGMIKELGAVHLTTISKPPQRVGNCSFASAKCGAEALELLLNFAKPGISRKAKKHAIEYEYFVKKEQFAFFMDLLNDIQKSNRRGKILSESTEFRMISEMCQKFYTDSPKYLDEILEGKFSLSNYSVENCIMDLHDLSEANCRGYLDCLLRFSLPGAFIIYKDRNHKVWLEGIDLKGAPIREAVHASNLQDVHPDIRYPMANYAAYRDLKKLMHSC